MGAQAVRLSNVDIDNALKNKDFEVLFQPIFDLGNGALARVETFVRWRHPALGVLPPGAFISFFESQGRMSELTRYVLAQALTEYRAWRESSAPGFSINLALSDLTDEAFSSHFSVLLRDSGFPAELITLECPMPPVTMETAQAAEHFHRLSQTGARLAIEVRGRANDFLRTIDPFPFDEIKTGGAAILRFARTVRGPGLSAISELLDIANKANAAITAVGVEDQASLSALRGLGFAAAQGNHLGKVGALASFDSERVNEVRGLLGLEPLNDEELAAMFRTEAPAPKQAEGENEAPPAAAPQEDDLVERLAARLARQPDDAKQPSAAAHSKAVSAKAALKAAAIARAKRKAAAEREPEESDADQAPPPAPPATDATPARSLQERLSRAFNADSLEEISEIGTSGVEDDGIDPEDLEEAGLEHEIDFGSLLDIGNETSANRAAGGVDASLDLILAAAAPGGDDTLDGLAMADAEFDLDAPSAPEEPAGLAETQSVPAAPDLSRQLAANTINPDGVMRARLAITGAAAHFRPGLRVGISQAQERAPGHLSTPPKSADVETIVIDDAPVLAPAPAASPEPALLDNPVAEDVTAPEPAAAPRRRNRQRKNFLKRTILPYPTHFWPKSWKRAWRRNT
ncbi:MAG: EAL domain-containing protein, partial [Amphiplicatus sp.]